MFFGGAALAGAFGGVVFSYPRELMLSERFLGIFAYTIGLMNGVGGRKGWQWWGFPSGCDPIIVPNHLPLP